MKTNTHTVQKTVKINKDSKGKREKVGTVQFLQPTLEEVRDHLNSPDAFKLEVKDEKEVEGSYDSDFTTMIDDAVADYCIKKLMGRLIPQTINFKPGQSAWTSLEELLAEAGKGKHFAIAAAWKTAVTTFITGLNKSDKFKADVISLLLVPAALAQTSATNKAIVQRVLTAFLESLEENDVDKFEKQLLELGTSIAFVPKGLEDEE